MAECMFVYFNKANPIEKYAKLRHIKTNFVFFMAITVLRNYTAHAYFLPTNLQD